MKFQMASSSVTMKSNPLGLGLSHGKGFSVESESFDIESFTVHLMGSLNFVQGSGSHRHWSGTLLKKTPNKKETQVVKLGGD